MEFLEGFARVTMPIHAFFGQQLEILRFYRRKDGRREIAFVHPHDRRGVLRVPIEWTDLGSPVEAPRVNARCPTLASRVARDLA